MSQGKNGDDAYVTSIDGQMVLIDPMGTAMITAVAKHNCWNTLLANLERVKHFERRISELQRSPQEVIIVVLNVDDPHGAVLADVLMPETDWQAFRERGEIPFARGLATRKGIEDAVTMLDEIEGEKLRNIDGVAAVVVDHGTVSVYEARAWAPISAV